MRVWETRTRQCLAQVHANRDVKISAVKILRDLCRSLREVDGSWGFYHKNGHQKLVMEEETNIQPGDKTAPFFVQQTSRNHPVEHEALSHPP